jgi:hypothetical protein
MDQAVTLRSDLELDLAVIGAGTAGLMLASALVRQGQRLRLIVLEPRSLSSNSRLWVFPSQPGHALEPFVSSRQARVQLLGRERALKRARLDIVRAGDVQAFALDQLSATGRNLVETRVRIDEIQAAGQGAVLTTSRGAIRARYVVDTRPGPMGAVPEGCWTQISWAAQVDAADIPPGFALARAETQGGCVMIDQSLALEDGTSQIETVGLCPPGEDGAAVKARLIERLEAMGADLQSLTLRRAVLPLNLDNPPASLGAVIHAPAGAGGLRFGPGLAALRSAEWAQMAARRFALTGRLPAPAAPRPARRAAAGRLIRQLEAGPDKAAAWLNQRLASLPAGAALRFLGGVPNWRDGAAPLQRRWTLR